MATFQGPVLLEVALVAHHQAHHVLVPVVLELLQPLLQVFEGGGPSDVVDQQGPHCSSIVGASHRPVPFLASRVPDLHLNGLAVNLDDFGGELDPDGGFAFEVELVFGESRDDVGLPHSRVPHQDDLELRLRLLLLPAHDLCYYYKTKAVSRRISHKIISQDNIIQYPII